MLKSVARASGFKPAGFGGETLGQTERFLLGRLPMNWVRDYTSSKSCKLKLRVFSVNSLFLPPRPPC